MFQRVQTGNPATHTHTHTHIRPLDAPLFLDHERTHNAPMTSTHLYKPKRHTHTHTHTHRGREMNPLIVLATIGIILMAGRGSPSGAEAGELSTANETSTGTTTPDKNVSELTLIEAFDAGELNSTQVLNYMNETGLTLGQSPCLFSLCDCLGFSLSHSWILSFALSDPVCVCVCACVRVCVRVCILFCHADDVYDSDWYANASATRQATRDAAIATNQDALTTSLGSSNSKGKSNKNKGKSNNNKGKSNNNKGKSNKKSSNDKQCQGSCQNGCPMPGEPQNPNMARISKLIERHYTVFARAKTRK